jgi:tRNA pseudouridine55 synthase
VSGTSVLKRNPAERRDPLELKARSGLLKVDKPAGVTSHDVVDRVRRRLKMIGAGHLGTLDPMASGLLLVATEAATRCATMWQAGEKTYEATVRFGVVTTTQDMTGDVIARRPVDGLDEARVRAAAAELEGEIDQVPPMVSALKVKGQRLYRLARRGIEVERAPRRVRVSPWEWIAFDGSTASFRVRCTSGTYVRTLAHDLGEKLGVGGALERLRRLRIEPYDLEGAVTLRDLDQLPADEVLERALIPLDRALAPFPSVTIDAADVLALGYGRAVTVRSAPGLPLDAGRDPVVLRDEDGGALAIGSLDPDPVSGWIARPHRVFPWAVREGRP